MLILHCLVYNDLLFRMNVRNSNEYLISLLLVEMTEYGNYAGH
jgi:hypothetical protein